MKNKKGLFAGVALFCFVFLTTMFVVSERERYEDVRADIAYTIKTQDVMAFACHEIVQAGKTTFLNLPESGHQYAEKKAQEGRAWLLNNGEVTEYVDNWMSFMIERKATPEETLNSYQKYFNYLLTIDGSAKYGFYLLRFVLLVLFSILPALGTLLVSSVTIVSAKYAFAAIALMFIVFATQNARSQTALEFDLLTDGKKPTSQILASTFGKKSTSLLFWTGNNLMAATGPNIGKLSLLAGVASGQGKNGATITSVNAWYIYYNKMLGGNWVTFGLFDQSLSAKDRWFWFKHELIWPVSKTIGLGGRLDCTLMTGQKPAYTYGPTFKLKWDGLTTWIHARLGGTKNVLFLRMEVPVPVPAN